MYDLKFLLLNPYNDNLIFQLFVCILTRECRKYFYEKMISIRVILLSKLLWMKIENWVKIVQSGLPRPFNRAVSVLWLSWSHYLTAALRILLLLVNIVPASVTTTGTMKIKPFSHVRRPRALEVLWFSFLSQSRFLLVCAIILKQLREQIIVEWSTYDSLSLCVGDGLAGGGIRLRFWF